MNRRCHSWAALAFTPLAIAACSEPPREVRQVSSGLHDDECRGDYCEVHTFTFEAGGGFQLVGIDEYCGRSGYPDGVLRVRGFSPRDLIALPTDGGDYVLFGRSGDTAIVRRYAERGEDCATGVRTITFDDGTTWTTGRRGTGATVPVDTRRVQSGGDGSDRLRGTRRVDALLGNGGDDRLYGYEEADVLSGGAGDDRLYGYEGDDILFDGPGDDLLVGDSGDDTYVITGGYGSRSTETIEDSAGDMRLLFLDPYLHNSDEAIFSRQGDSLVLGFSRAQDNIVFSDYFRERARLTSALFNDGAAEGEALRALLRAAEERSPVLRYRDAVSGLVQASATGHVFLGCRDAEYSTPTALGTLPLVVLNVRDDARIAYRELSNDCGEIARLAGSAIEGRIAPPCPAPGEQLRCRVVLEALADGERSDVLTLEITSTN